METNRRRERERETERGRGRGERERCKWWAVGCFRVVSDLFLSVGYLSFGEKTGKNGKRKKRRELAFPDRCRSFRTAILQLEYVLGACFSGPLQRLSGPDYNKSTFWVLAFPDRCRSFRAAMATIRIRFGCLLFRTAAHLSGPQCLQLECVLGARFSGPLHAFPDRNRYD